jgi:hypothetical protein
MKMKKKIANFMKDYESLSKKGDSLSVLTSLIKDLKRRAGEWDLIMKTAQNLLRI